jgi:hypothetical protein
LEEVTFGVLDGRAIVAGFAAVIVEFEFIFFQCSWIKFNQAISVHRVSGRHAMKSVGNFV